jgi:hypothetical protein
MHSEGWQCYNLLYWSISPHAVRARVLQWWSHQRELPIAGFEAESAQSLGVSDEKRSSGKLKKKGSTELVRDLWQLLERKLMAENS